MNEMRDGKLVVTKEAVTLLLSAVDFLRDMIAASKNKDSYDTDSFTNIQKQLITLVDEKPAVEPDAKNLSQKDDVDKDDGCSPVAWHISFYPHENFFYTGNDPFRLIRELQGLGTLDVHADATRLPDFSELDVENCYLGWEMSLEGNVTLNEINEVFAWVEGDCDLEINLVDNRRSESDRRQQSESSMSGRRKTDAGGRARSESASIRVSTEKVDGLLNLVGELVIAQSILSRIVSDLSLDSEKLDEVLEQLERNTREMQEQTMSIRMLPIDFALQRLPRIVHDLSHSLGKKVELNIAGEATELDKTVLEKIGDPLVHLVRNALDHGIESPEVRRAAGKDETGVINVSAHHLGGSIIIEIDDDGAGIDPKKVRDKAIACDMINEKDELSQTQIYNLIFQPGFSTASQVSDVSGRGVGMDVVKRNITDLGGTVELTSKPGVGSRFTIRLPLTLAILDGQMIRVGSHVYIIPMHSIIETLQVSKEKINAIAETAEFYQYRDEYISILRLHDVFKIDADEAGDHSGLLVVIDIGRQRIGLYVDEIVGQQQVVIKSLESNFKHVDGLAGATVLGDGSVAFILDVMSLSQYQARQGVDMADVHSSFFLH